MEKIAATVFSMWSIESGLAEDDLGAPYDRRAAAYDRMVRSRAYNRLLWSTSPRDYEAFAAAALADACGPLLDAGAGTAAATAALHRDAGRPVVLVDRSRPMLERAALRIAGGEDAPLPGHVRLVQADLEDLPFAPGGFATVLCMGVLHLWDDPRRLVERLRAQLAPGGRLHVSALVAARPVGRRYLRALHRAGEVAAPRTPAELEEVLGTSVDVRGSMAYAVLGAGSS